EFLQASVPRAYEGPLRAAILAQTTAVLRLRRWGRRAALATALAACYLAGLLTMYWAAPQPREVRVIVDRMPPPLPEADPPAPPSIPEADEDAGVPGLILERRVLLAKDGGQPGRWRRAGDRYMEEGDISSALRCYTRALEGAGENELAIAVEDNWLLMTLKEARRKEGQY